MKTNRGLFSVLCVALALQTATTSAKIELPEDPYQFQFSFGTPGQEPGQLQCAWGIGIDAAGNIYVAESPNNRVSVFDSTGHFVRAWGTTGSGDGEFDAPWGVAVDKAGNVYVVERIGNRVQKFAADGTFITKWGELDTGGSRFREPMGIAVDSSGNVYVADTENQCIQKFNPDGTFIAGWATHAPYENPAYPASIAIDSFDRVYVAESALNRVSKYTSSGDLLTRWGGYGFDNGQFYCLYGIGVDRTGNVFTSEYRAEWGMCRIQKFDADGVFLTTWGPFGVSDGEFCRPWGIVSDPKGNVYISDASRQRVQVFAPHANHPPVADAGGDLARAYAGVDGTAIVLDGAGSADPDGDALSFTWTGPFPEGNGRVTGVNPTVTLPLGTSTITLVVNDGKVDSTPATVNVTVALSVEGFLPPLARLVREGQAIQLPDRAFKLGRALPMKLQLSCGVNPCLTGLQAPRVVGLVRSGEAADLGILNLDAGSANDSGLTFRQTDCAWVYNFSTSGLAPGSYLITIAMPDGLRYEGGFVLRQ